jgi:hypothetical protein
MTLLLTSNEKKILLLSPAGKTHRKSVKVPVDKNVVWETYKTQQTDLFTRILDNLPYTVKYTALDFLFSLKQTPLTDRYVELLIPYANDLLQNSFYLRGKRFFNDPKETEVSGSDLWLIINSLLCLMISIMAPAYKDEADKAYEQLYQDLVLKSAILFPEITDARRALIAFSNGKATIIPGYVSLEEIEKFNKKHAHHLLKVSLGHYPDIAVCKSIIKENDTWAIYAYLKAVVRSEVLPQKMEDDNDEEYYNHYKEVIYRKIGLVTMTLMHFIYMKGLIKKYAPHSDYMWELPDLLFPKRLGQAIKFLLHDKRTRVEERNNLKFIMDFPDDYSAVENTGDELKEQLYKVGLDCMNSFLNVVFRKEQKPVMVKGKLHMAVYYILLDRERTRMLLSDVSTFGNFPARFISPLLVSKIRKGKNHLLIDEGAMSRFSVLGQLTVSIKTVNWLSDSLTYDNFISKTDKKDENSNHQFIFLLRHLSALSHLFDVQTDNAPLLMDISLPVIMDYRTRHYTHIPASPHSSKMSRAIFSTGEYILTDFTDGDDLKFSFLVNAGYLTSLGKKGSKKASTYFEQAKNISEFDSDDLVTAKTLARWVLASEDAQLPKTTTVTLDATNSGCQIIAMILSNKSLGISSNIFSDGSKNSLEHIKRYDVYDMLLQSMKKHPVPPMPMNMVAFVEAFVYNSAADKKEKDTYEYKSPDAYKQHIKLRTKHEAWVNHFRYLVGAYIQSSHFDRNILKKMLVPTLFGAGASRLTDVNIKNVNNFIMFCNKGIYFKMELLDEQARYMFAHGLQAEFRKVLSKTFPAIGLYFDLTKFIVNVLGGRKRLKWSVLEGTTVVMDVSATVKQQFRVRNVGVGEKRGATSLKRPMLDENGNSVPDVESMLRSFSANFTHSVDGAIAFGVIKRCHAAGFKVLTIHDAFSCAPTHAEDLIRFYQEESLLVGALARTEFHRLLGEAVAQHREDVSKNLKPKYKFNTSIDYYEKYLKSVPVTFAPGLGLFL